MPQFEESPAHAARLMVSRPQGPEQVPNQNYCPAHKSFAAQDGKDVSASLEHLFAHRGNHPSPPTPQAPSFLRFPGAQRLMCQTEQPIHDNPSAQNIILLQGEHQIDGYRQKQEG